MNRTLALVLLAAALPAAAHTGVGPHSHGGFTDGFAHPFLGLDHLLAMVAVGLWAARAKGGAMLGAPAAFLAGMLGGAVLAITTSLVPPFVEVGVIGSAIALCVLVAIGIAPNTIAALAAVAVFGGFHGFAHGLEMPGYLDPIPYAFGFLAATALLHAAGLGFGRIAVLMRRGHRIAAD